MHMWCGIPEMHEHNAEMQGTVVPVKSHSIAKSKKEIQAHSLLPF